MFKKGIGSDSIIMEGLVHWILGGIEDFEPSRESDWW